MSILPSRDRRGMRECVLYVPGFSGCTIDRIGGN
jgi:hypothetical protein